MHRVYRTEKRFHSSTACYFTINLSYYEAVFSSRSRPNKVTRHPLATIDEAIAYYPRDDSIWLTKQRRIKVRQECMRICWSRVIHERVLHSRMSNRKNHRETLHFVKVINIKYRFDRAPRFPLKFDGKKFKQARGSGRAVFILCAGKQVATQTPYPKISTGRIVWRPATGRNVALHEVED